MMPKNPRYRVPVRRRREQKTDYYLRRKLLVSRLPRLVVRRNINNISAQIIESLPEGDRVLVTAHSNELRKNYGWKGHCGNIPAAYLTGLLIGLKAQKKKIKKTILDIGLQPSVKNNSLFAVLRVLWMENLIFPTVRMYFLMIPAYAVNIYQNTQRHYLKNLNYIINNFRNS